MKKQLILVITLLSLGFTVTAQKEYKLTKSSGRINLNINGAIVEGYNGNEIIFSAPATVDKEVDERAKGLRAISGSGYTDNTGLGIEVTEKGQDVNVNSVGKRVAGVLTIKVPQGMKVTFSNTSSIHQSDIILKNLKSEIEVSTSYNKIKLENNTGPMNIKTLYGSVDATFGGDIKGPVSILSVYGYVDVSMPNATKANVELGTSYGNLYAAEGLKIAIDKPLEKVVAKNTDTATANVMIVGRPNVVATVVNGVRISGNTSSATVTRRTNGIGVASFSTSRDVENIKGKINGGGTDLIFKSTYQNVYLREK